MHGLRSTRSSRLAGRHRRCKASSSCLQKVYTGNNACVRLPLHETWRRAAMQELQECYSQRYRVIVGSAPENGPLTGRRASTGVQPGEIATKTTHMPQVEIAGRRWVRKEVYRTPAHQLTMSFEAAAPRRGTRPAQRQQRELLPRASSSKPCAVLRHGMWLKVACLTLMGSSGSLPHRRAVQLAFAQALECDVADTDDLHRAVEQLLP